jgi:hypothetical protein
MRGILLVATAGCVTPLPVVAPDASTRAVTLADQTVATPGETMEFRALLRGITVGHIAVAVGDAGWVDGRRAVIVRTQAGGSGVLAMVGELRAEITTTLDLARGLPIKNVEEAWLDVAGKHEHHRRANTWQADDRDHDPVSAVAAIRAWRSRAGVRTELEVGLERKTVTVAIWDVGRELLRSAKVPAIRYQGTVRDRFPFTAWISDDLARVPLRLEIETELGEIVIELLDYHAPSDN